MGMHDIIVDPGFGFGKLKSPNGYDNFEIIEGIGPKINSVLQNDWLRLFQSVF